MRKHVPSIVVVIVIATIAVIALRPAATEVDVATVVRGRLQVTVDEDGETRVRDRFVVSAPVTGRVQRIELEPGEPVVQGRTVVARIAPSTAPLLDTRVRAELGAAIATADAAVGQAKAERDRAAALLDRMQTTLHRQETLIQAGAISLDELDATATTVRTARSVLKAAEFAVARAERERQVAAARLQTPAARGRAVGDRGSG